MNICNFPLSDDINSDSAAQGNKHQYTGESHPRLDIHHSLCLWMLCCEKRGVLYTTKRQDRSQQLMQQDTNTLYIVCWLDLGVHSANSLMIQNTH